MYRLGIVLVLLHANFAVSAFSPQRPQRLLQSPSTSTPQPSDPARSFVAKQSAFVPLEPRKAPACVPSSLFATKSDDEGSSSRAARLFSRFTKGRKNDKTKPADGKTEKMSVVGMIKKAHNPKTYLLLSALVGFKWRGCFRSIFYWLPVAFFAKWYRARYVFNIPVWDRQPNWNNVITSKEQEKDLKAFTCKTCGSTLFIAKTREFFFEGGTGLAGLGCFTCGAKGKDNFVMDRDRIVEDVGDMDDYFEYERPLDFVSAAERRKLMKEAGGDEERANQILLERETTPASELDKNKDAFANGSSAVTEDGEATAQEDVSGTENKPKKSKKKKKKKKKTPALPEASVETVEDKPASKPSPAPSPAPKSKKEEPPADDFDILDMDSM